MPEIEKTIEEKVAELALKQIEKAKEYKSPWYNRQQLAWNLYNNVPRPAIAPNRANLIVPVMSGFVNTLRSKIANPPHLKYAYADMADMPRAEKVQSAYEQHSDIMHDNWAIKDVAASTSAIFTGRAIFKYIPDKKNPTLMVVDPLSFLTEPYGGGQLESQQCMGELNVYLEKWQLEEGADSGIYDKTQVQKLIDGAVEGVEATVNQEEAMQEKERRLRAMGLEPSTRSYMSDTVFCMAEWYTTYKGTRYYVLLDVASHIWVRCVPLKKIYKSEEWPYASWSPFYDHWNFWPKAPVDDMVYLCEGIQISVNSMFDSVNELNWPQLLVDQEAVKDQTQLIWQPRGIIEIDRHGTGEPLDNFVKTFAPSADKNAPQITINLVRFLQGIAGKETGVTADAQGASDEKQVGIMVGNLQQVADTMRMYDDSRKMCWNLIGKKFWQGLNQYTPTDWMVKVMGTKGVGWKRDKLTKGDVNPITDFDITVTGGDTEARIDELKRAAKMNDTTLVINNPMLLEQVNPKTMAEVILSRNHDSDEVKKLMDKDEQGGSQLIARAEQYIQDILDGRKPPLEFAATTQFIKHISDFATDHFNDLDIEDFKKLMAYAKAHQGIAVRNVMNRAQQDFMSDVRAGNQQGADPLAGMSKEGMIPPPTNQNPVNPVSPENPENPAVQNPEMPAGANPVTAASILSNAMR